MTLIAFNFLTRGRTVVTFLKKRNFSSIVKRVSKDWRTPPFCSRVQVIHKGRKICAVKFIFVHKSVCRRCNGI